MARDFVPHPAIGKSGPHWGHVSGSYQSIPLIYNFNCASLRFRLGSIPAHTPKFIDRCEPAIAWRPIHVHQDVVLIFYFNKQIEIIYCFSFIILIYLNFYKLPEFLAKGLVSPVRAVASQPPPVLPLPESCSRVRSAGSRKIRHAPTVERGERISARDAARLRQIRPCAGHGRPTA